MKKIVTPFNNLRSLAYFLFLFFIVGSYGCVSVNAIKESPIQFGYGFQVDPGLQIGDSYASGHVLLGYSRIPFKGGGGYTRIWQYGGQIRSSLTRFPDPGLWFGGEITYLGISLVPDNGTKSTAGGFTLGGLAGYRFPIGRVPASIYFAPAYLNRGKFKTSGISYGGGSSGFYGRLGLDLHLFSLLNRRGR